MAEERLIDVFEAGDAVEAMLYRTMLEEAGITVIEQPMEIIGYGGIMPEQCYSRLLVSAEDEQRARELIEAFHEEAQSGELIDEFPDDENT